MHMFKLLFKLIFGSKVREYVATHSVEFIRPSGYYYTPSLYHVVYKCYNTKSPTDVWYEAEASGIVQKIQPDLYVHHKRFSEI
jgi:hypothetical protein